MSLVDHFRYHSSILAAKSSALDIIHHAGDRGAEREDILEEFLSPRLPERLAIGRGELRASNGNWSRQEDLIIYDRLNCPRLFVGERSQIFPVESVAAVVEVKTSLGSREIMEATENIRRARSLEKLRMSTSIGPGSIQFGRPTPLLGVLFAFDIDVSLETFRKRWDEAQSAIPANQRINLVCVLGKMVMLHIDNAFHLWDHAGENMLGKFIGIDSGQDSLLTFTLPLMRVLGEYRFGVPDLFMHVFSGGDKLELKFLFGPDN